MADYRLKYTGAEVDQSILDSKKINEMYDTIQNHLNTHMTNQAREILLGNIGDKFRSNNVEEAMGEMYDDLYKAVPTITEAFEQYNNQVVVTDAEIDTIIANALQ